jgi:hypothetical protein
MDELSKQPYEAFTLSVDFGANMISGETIASQTVTAADSEGNDVTDTVLDTALTVNDGATKVLFYVRAGSPTASPYKLTVRCVTSATHRWEKDIKLKVKEL